MLVKNKEIKRLKLELDEIENKTVNRVREEVLREKNNDKNDMSLSVTELREVLTPRSVRVIRSRLSKRASSNLRSIGLRLQKKRR